MLKILRRRTDLEILNDAILSNIKCSDFSQYRKKEWWFCTRCSSLFSPDDVVLLQVTKKGDRSLLCPTVFETKKLFRQPISSQCRKSLYSGDKRYFDDNYLYDEKGAGQ